MTTETTTGPLGYIQVYAPYGKPLLVDHMGEPWETAELAQADLAEDESDPELWRVVALVEVAALQDAAEGRRLAAALLHALRPFGSWAENEIATAALAGWVNAGDGVTR